MYYNPAGTNGFINNIFLTNQAMYSVVEENLFE
jgi:hypothetical protein